MATKNLSIRLAVIDGNKSKKDLKDIGDAGDKALKKISKSSEPASKGFKKVGDSSKKAFDKISKASKPASAKLRVLNTVSEELKGTFSGVAGKAGILGTSLQKFGTIGTVAAVGIGLVVTGLGLITKRTLEAASEIEDLSVRLGTSTEALSQYRFATKVTGVAFTEFTQGLQRMTRRLSEAAIGQGIAKSALDELGLSANELVLLRPEQAFERIAEEIDKLPSQFDKVRIAFKFFDTGGVKLLQTMEGGAAAIREFKEESDRLGTTLTALEAEKLASADTALTELGGAFGGLSKEIVVTFAPAMKGLTETFTEFIVATKDAVKAVGDFEKTDLRQENLTILENPLLGFLSGVSPEEIGKRIEEIDNQIQTERLARIQKQADERKTALENATKNRGVALIALEKDIQKKLDAVSKSPRQKVLDETNALLEKIRALDIEGDSANKKSVDKIKSLIDELNKVKLGKLGAGSIKEAERAAEANDKVVFSLLDRIDALNRTEKEQFIHEAVSRLNEKADSDLVETTKNLASALFEEKKALDGANEARKKRISSQEKDLKIIEDLKKSLASESKDDRSKAVDSALDKLSEFAGPKQIEDVKRLSGALFDLKEAQEAATKAQEAAKGAAQDINSRFSAISFSLDDAVASAEKWKNETIGALDETSSEYDSLAAKADVVFSQMLTDAYDQALQASDRWEDGAARAFKSYADEAGNVAGETELLFSGIMDSLEDSLTDFISSGKLSLDSFSDFISDVENDLIRFSVRQGITKPLAEAGTSFFEDFKDFNFGSLFSGFSTLHKGGIVGRTNSPTRFLPSSIIPTTPRFQNGLAPDEFPAILHRGEEVIPKDKVNKRNNRSVVVNMTVNAKDVTSFNRSRTQIAAKLQQSLNRGSRIL